MDGSTFRWFNRLADHTTWAHGLVRFYAENGIVLFGVLIVVVYFVVRRRADHQALASVVWSGGAALVALLVGQLVGGPIDCARPYAAIPNVHVLVARSTDFSFPSDHALVAGAVAAGLLFADRSWGLVAAFAAVLMAFARVYAGDHYPGDVVAGLVFGAIVAIVGRYTLVPLLTGLVDRLIRAPLRPLLTNAPAAALTAKATAGR